MENRKQFRPYDRVLVRHHNDSIWNIDFYSHYNNENCRHETFCSAVKNEDRIISYEGNEHLVGTCDEPEEEIKLEEGEWLMVSDYIEGIYKMYCASRKFVRIEGNTFIVKSRACDKDYFFAIRFSDFNPNDMEETSKHILCIKNGKIVKYKE